MITNISEELMSKFLPMFVPTPNQARNEGSNRDCWTVNPDCLSSQQKEMWLCLGKLFGMAIRTSNHLNLSVAPLFWKRLCLDPHIGVADVKSIDECCFQTLMHFNELGPVTEEEFSMAFMD